MFGLSAILVDGGGVLWLCRMFGAGRGGMINFNRDGDHDCKTL